MKKILAIAMAIVMMMAIAVPAFAVPTGTVTGGNPNANETIINTDTEDKNGNDPTWYTVTIPATVTIPWGEATWDVEFSVASQLATGKGVKVNVTGDGVMTNAAGAELGYTLSSTEFKTNAPVFDNSNDKAAAVVGITDWATVAVDAYSDTLTFEATVFDLA